MQTIINSFHTLVNRFLFFKFHHYKIYLVTLDKQFAYFFVTWTVIDMTVSIHIYISAFPGGSVLNNLPVKAGDSGLIMGQEDPLEKLFMISVYLQAADWVISALCMPPFPLPNTSPRHILMVNQQVTIDKTNHLNTFKASHAYLLTFHWGTKS